MYPWNECSYDEEEYSREVLIKQLYPFDEPDGDLVPISFGVIKFDDSCEFKRLRGYSPDKSWDSANFLTLDSEIFMLYPFKEFVEGSHTLQVYLANN